MELDKIKEILDKEPEEAVDEMLEEVEKRYGEIPYIINFMKDMPELFISRMIYENSVMREFKRMDPRTVELICIAVASALRCEHCLKTHVRVAKRLGISREEIFDSVLIASTVSTAAVLAEGTRSVDTVLNESDNDMSSTCSICNINSGLPDED